MGPLFVLLVAAILAGLFALGFYIILWVVRRKPVSLLGVVGIVVGGGVGAVLAILILALFFAGETLESRALIIFYLSSIVISAIVFGIVGLKFIERRQGRI
jgi:hypothetical protein